MKANLISLLLLLKNKFFFFSLDLILFPFVLNYGNLLFLFSRKIRVNRILVLFLSYFLSNSKRLTNKKLIKFFYP